MKNLDVYLKENCNEEELLDAMGCTPLKKGYIRLSAIYDLMNGLAKDKVIKKSKISERTLQFWIQKFVDKGIDSLISKPKIGRPKILSNKEKKYLINKY